MEKEAVSPTKRQYTNDSETDHYQSSDGPASEFQ